MSSWVPSKNRKVKQGLLGWIAFDYGKCTVIKIVRPFLLVVWRQPLIMITLTLITLIMMHLLFNIVSLCQQKVKLNTVLHV